MGQAFLESDENIVVSHITWHIMYIARLSIQGGRWGAARSAVAAVEFELERDRLEASTSAFAPPYLRQARKAPAMKLAAWVS